mmetsp:Transcript_23572/g.30811  ORF Transcript_23572/g.30811 Transcript_23572/m.30811 type:complete len:744 (+) Transcript_23572:165-2396(+)
MQQPPMENRAEFQEIVTKAFQELVASGIPVNDAAAQAIVKAKDVLAKSKKDDPVEDDLAEDPMEEDAESETVQSLPDSPEIISSDVLKQCLEEGKKMDDTAAKYRPLIHFIGRAFSASRSLNASFPPHISDMDIQEEKKEQEGEVEIDIEEVSAVYDLLIKLDHEGVSNAMTNAFESLLYNLQYNVQTLRESLDLRQFLIVFECPQLIDPAFKNVLTSLFQCISKLPKTAQEKLIRWFSRQSCERLNRYLSAIQQYITVQIYMGNVEATRPAALVLGMLVQANDRRDEPSQLPYQQFYNDAVNAEILNEQSETSFHEYQLWRRDLREQREAQERGNPTNAAVPQSLVSYPFLLDAASKAVVINLDSRVQMRREIDNELQAMLLGGDLHRGLVTPYLILRVHRHNIVQDTLTQLALHPDDDLKKPLKVQFIGEEGVDEGGVQKEFFQVVTRELLDPQYGMFKVDQETNTLWFNSDTLEANLEFELIGTLLGIAIYNAVIVDVQFPRVVYKKLEGMKPTLEDLKATQPGLGRGLEQLLKTEDDVETMADLTFQLSYEVFGEIKSIDLKPNGSNIPVTKDNRQEYVDLYVQWLLEKSIESQFSAFRRGFMKVCGGEAMKLFRPEDVELLICGNPVLDFAKLEKVTRYEDGFTVDSPVIKHFWEIVHGFDEDHKKRLLKFVTGSDRAPINGLESMIFVISRNGDDSDRLPTAHTCFNHLLLPEYSSLEKLKDRLTLAIEQSEGFGLR